MPNPVVSFEIRGRDTDALRAFYAALFDWQIDPLPGGAYSFVETNNHEHADDGSTRYTGPDAYLNDGVVLGADSGQPAWKLREEQHWRYFEPGIGGGIGRADSPGVSVYVQVPDLDATLKRAVELGGTLVREPSEVGPNIHVAAFADPEGNRMT